MGKYIDFFLGANTPIGFVSRYDQICENSSMKKIYIIKGGAGTGKSSMMKKIGESVNEKTDIIERIHCSSDPKSLDAVISEEKGFAILDGTPPHPVEPKYPGAYETIVNLYPFFDERGLGKRIDKIKYYVKKYTDCHKKACAYLGVASLLLQDNINATKGFVNYKKLMKYAENLANREFGKKKGEKTQEKIRFLSAVTPEGVKFYNLTVESLCDKVYIIEDDIGNVSNCILNVLKEKAMERGLAIISSYCITSPYEKLEHIIVPELKIAFLTCNKFHKIEFSKTKKRVKASRFTDISKLYEKKQYLSFNKRAAKEFVNQAVKAMQEAKSHHDSLEECYIDHVNFDKLNQLTDDLLNKINHL